MRCDDFRFTYVKLHSRGFSVDSFRRYPFLSEVISLCPTRWKNLDYRIYLPRLLAAFLPFLVLLAFPKLAFRLRLAFTVVFSTILRGSSGSFLLSVPLFHQRQILSFAVLSFPSSKDLLFPDLFHFFGKFFLSVSECSLYLLCLKYEFTWLIGLHKLR